MTTGPAKNRCPTGRAWVALGSNLGDRAKTLCSATHAIDTSVPDSHVISCSRIYETRPIGPSCDPFLNAAIELVTALSPGELLLHLHRIEAEHHRERWTRWEARTLDLDLIAFTSLESGELVRDASLDGVEHLHPRAHLRDFVLQPLIDLGVTIPLHDGWSPEQLLAAIPPAARTILRSYPAQLTQHLGRSS